MHSPFAQGFSYFREALPLLLRPGLRLFVILPLLVNLLVFGGLIVFALQLFNDTLAHLMGSVPDWLSWLDWLLWPLFVVLMLLTVFFTFSLLANLIAAPFNGFLAEKIEVVLRGRDDFPPFSLQELAAMVPRTVGRELRKLAYFLPRAIPLLLLTFIPLINLVAIPLWLLFGVWMLAIQYVDYPADNNKLSWPDMLAWLREKRWQSLGFGGTVYLALLVPFANILVMPVAVAGATLFWVREGGVERVTGR
jgi:CysZ protein